MELLTKKKISRSGLCSANKSKLLTTQITTRKAFASRAFSVYGTIYQTISGPQQTIIPSKENLKHTYLN